MLEFVEIILASGRSAVELALFILLPVMVVMLTVMRLLEACGVLDRMVSWTEPLLRPFGIPGLGVFAMLQILFVSFAGPVATLRLMDRDGTSDRHIASTLALVLGLSQANVVLPMATMGLHVVWTWAIAAFGALLGAAATWYVFGRRLSIEEPPPPPLPEHTTIKSGKSLLDLIQESGKEAFEISTGAIPMLILALLCVGILRESGAIDALGGTLAPLFNAMDVPPELLLLVITKCIAGGTAMMGVSMEFLEEGLLSMDQINAGAGFLITPLDLAGLAVLISAGPRVAKVFRPALYGGLVGVAVRTIIHPLIF